MGYWKKQEAIFQESHLQEAILAQQASTSGIAVENHVIPTPRVFTVDREHYDAVYPVQPAPSINQLIKVQGTVQVCLRLSTSSFRVLVPHPDPPRVAPR